MKYKIRKNIPLPKRPGRNAGPSPYPFVDMRPGESFEVPVTAENRRRIEGSLRGHARRIPNFYIAIRHSENVIGVWRVTRSVAEAAKPKLKARPPINLLAQNMPGRMAA